MTSIPAQFIGLDVGDRLTHVCGLDGGRRVVERTRIATTREALLAAFADHPPARIVLEVGSQSPWLSSLLRELGHDVLVADARRVAAITRSGRKTDRRDAETLARLLAGMPELLGSVRHRGRQAQADLALIRARDVFVQTSTRCRQHVRGVLKSFGLRMPKCSGRAFRKAALEVIPEELQPALLPVLAQLEAVERTIHDYDRRIEQLGTERHPDTARLRQVNSVGPLVSLAFVLTIDDPKRFAKSRDVGSFLGLCPRVQASGDSDPQLPISKTGCGYMRRLLVQSAQYILGPFGKDSDLRRFGLRLCERGGKAAKRRAVVAVARKLAVLLHRLWVSGAPYEPLRNAKPA
ncbi:MAG TPA: IS110 family transposase [Planctomycetota bacterium]|nr:IS110 family transposase [Planctomycetota bacterium]